MNEGSISLQPLRPPGPVAATCRLCPFFDRCGGIQNSRPLLNCFEQFCCGSGKCDNICVYKPDFLERLTEIGGLRFDDIPLLRQDRIVLPTYVPMIHHPYRRSRWLDVSYAALDTYDIFRLREPIDSLLAENVRAHAAWLEAVRRSDADTKPDH